MEQTDKRKQDKLKFDRVINLARRLPRLFMLLLFRLFQNKESHG